MEIAEYESFKTALQNIIKNSNRTQMSKHTKTNYLAALKLYNEFVNNKEGILKQITPDDLIVEARSDAEKAKEQIRLFFLWLQGQPIPNYKPRSKSMRQTSAFIRAYSQVRGFYTNNGIIFGKWKTPNIADMKKEAIENDVTVPFFKYEGRKVYLDRAILKQFLANLKLRDQSIFLCMLSSSQDSGDLFSLSVGDIRKQEKRDRFFWEAQRGKTQVRFKTFFSIEATNFVRRYIDQERSEADNRDPLFVYNSRRKGQTRAVEECMTSNWLGSVFRRVARKMGLPVGNGFQNVFRPKRLRHVFRTAFTHAHVDEGYIHAFMGHRSSISQDYLGKDLTTLEIEYSRAEPLLTVYGIAGTEELEKIQNELSEWKGKVADLNDKFDALTAKFEEKVLEIEQKFNQRLDDFNAERQSFVEEEKENVKIKKELPEPTEEEILRLMPEKISKSSKLKKLEPKEESKPLRKESIPPTPSPKPEVESTSKDCPKCKSKESLNLIEGTETWRCIKCGYMEKDRAYKK